MIVLITFLKLMMKMTLENMVLINNINQNLKLGWDYLWMEMDYLYLIIYILVI